MVKSITNEFLAMTYPDEYYKNVIEPAMVLEYVDKQLKKNIQNGGDGYTIDVNKSINGMVGWSRYSF